MDDTKIVIDAGHGGTDPGAIGNGYQEKDINLRISNYMYNRFKELGIPVKIIRSTDETISPKARVQRILDAYGNDPNVLVISNHINAGGGEGAEVIYALRNNGTFARLILEGIGAEGQKTRKYYQRRLPSNPTKDYNFLFRDTGITEPVIVEYGFIDDAADINRVVNNYEKYAEAVVKAVTDYKGLPYSKPGSSAGTILYTVQSGDSLYGIARRYNTTVNEIKRLNGLTSDLLTVGRQLLLPSSESIDESKQDGTYTVKLGDTLYGVARTYGVTVDELKRANNLTNNILTVGQVLNIPKQTGTTDNSYTVQSGDSLYSIARRFNTTVDELKTINNLTSDILSIGQKLLIPSSTERTYIVKSGDSLWKISREFGVSVNEIRKLNNLTSDILTIGQQLIIP